MSYLEIADLLKELEPKLDYDLHSLTLMELSSLNSLLSLIQIKKYRNYIQEDLKILCGGEIKPGTIKELLYKMTHM